MSARNSLQIDERRPLAMIDTETTDYYDDIGGIPPPHRLSGLYNQGGHSPSSSGFNLANMMNTGGHHSSSHGSAEDSIRSPSYATQGLNNYQPSTRELQQQQQNQNQNFQEFPMSTSFTSNRLYQNNYSDSRTGLTTSGSFTNEKNAYSMHDDSIHAGDNVAFLGGGNMVERGGMSPAVAARERYMARKEAQGNQYAYGAGAGAGGLGGAEMGNMAGAGGSSRGCFAGKRKWIWIVGIGAIVIAAIVGIAVGVSKHKSAGSNSALTAVSGDPSSFTPTAGLYRSFYGMDYTPLNSQYPACGDTLEDVIQDVQLMSQLTPRFRVYGSDCNVATFSLAAINQTQVNMTVFLAAWVPQPTADDADATWTRQKNQVISAIQTYGSDHVEGVTVGNEYLLNGGTVSDLLEKVTEMRTALAALNLPKTIAVGTADAGSMITSTLAEGCDFVGANVHPWFGGVPVDQAAGWVYEYTSTNTPASALQASNKPKLYIAETGWPTNANDTASLTYEGAQAGVPELNTFLESYICQANQNITAGGEYSNYFFFEMFDEPWKAIYGGVEEYWGLFNANKTLKNGLVIPNCPIS